MLYEVHLDTETVVSIICEQELTHKMIMRSK